MRRTIMGVAAAAALVTAVPADAQAACANADKHPSQASVKQLRAATVCLVNVERRKHGRSKLRANAGLALAGQRHARDMVKKRYFAHNSRAGRINSSMGKPLTAAVNSRSTSATLAPVIMLARRAAASGTLSRPTSTAGSSRPIRSCARWSATPAPNWPP